MDTLARLFQHPLLGHRLINLYGFLLSVTAMAFAVLYLQETLGYNPCPLCIFQRVAMIATGIIFLLAFVHSPAGQKVRLYAIPEAIAAISGIAVSARHSWLQHLPADEVPACGPGLEYMLDAFPLMQALELVLRGSGECADLHWSFLGLSIPEATLLVFAGLLAMAVFNGVRRVPVPGEGDG